MIRITNYGDLPFSGWFRTTTDLSLPLAAGGSNWRKGRPIGIGLHAIDVLVEGLLPKHTLQVEPLSDSSPIDVMALPSDPVAYFGGYPRLNGIDMVLEAVTADGAGYQFQLHGRVGPMLHVRLWVLWYPDEPGLGHAEVAITCSNGASTDLVGFAPEGIHLTWGGAALCFLDLNITSTILRPGEWFGDGQSRILPLKIIFPHLIEGNDVLSIIGHLKGSIWGVGVSKLYPQGNPVYPYGFDAKKWTTDRYRGAKEGLENFSAPVCGPVPRSNNSGEQEDQVFVRGESLFGGEEGALSVAYFSALKLAARPCHHLEANGKLADSADHPNTMFWFGRPHFATPDHLGKLEAPSVEIWRGWEGPDREHWLYNTLFAAARQKDSKALQWLLEAQAHIYLFQETVPSPRTNNWFTNGVDAARSVGWANWLAVLLWTALEDRSLALRVRARWLERFEQVYLPNLQGKDIWDVRVDDPRCGPGEWWMPWQQAVGAYFLDVACEMFDKPQGRAIALQAAKTIVNRNIFVRDGRFVSYDYHRVDESAHTPGTLWLFGTPLAVATVLRHDPGDFRAREIRQQMVLDAQQSKQTSWLPPEM